MSKGSKRRPSEAGAYEAGWERIFGYKGVKIGKDGRCLCSCADKCPLGRAGSMDRCRRDELEEAGIATINSP